MPRPRTRARSRSGRSSRDGRRGGRRPRRSAVLGQQAREGEERGALAGAALAREGEDAAPFDVEVDAVDGEDVAARGGREQRKRTRSPRTSRASGRGAVPSGQVRRCGAERGRPSAHRPEADRQHGQGDRDARDEDQVGGDADDLAAVRDHAAPADQVGIGEPQERQGRLHEDGRADVTPTSATTGWSAPGSTSRKAISSGCSPAMRAAST